MAQLVPCSGSMQQDFGLGVLDVPTGQTVPSSPTFSTWNYSPPSYWSDASPTVVKSEPIGTLEELLDDYTYEPTTTDKSEGHALLRQCLRPVADDSHLEFLNQIGSAIAASPMQQEQESSLKAEKTYWNPPPQTSTANPAQGLASVLTMVMEQVNEEVRSTCDFLGVSPSK